MTTTTLTPQAKYEAVVAEIMKAVPEIEHSWHDLHEDVSLFQQFDVKSGTLKRPITLEDVLRAMDNKGNPNYSVTLDGKIWSVEAWGYDKKKCTFHLGHDLKWHRDNAPELIDFLYDILL